MDDVHRAVPDTNAEQLLPVDDLSDLDDVISHTSKVMIVDDEPIIAEMVKHFLYTVGYRHIIPITEPTKVMA